MQPTRNTRDPLGVRLCVSPGVTGQSVALIFCRAARGAYSCVIW
jgi:hypothetical protein